MSADKWFRVTLPGGSYQDVKGSEWEVREGALLIKSGGYFRVVFAAGQWRSLGPSERS